MDRAEWLKKMRTQAESLYDRLAPAYWVTFGQYANTTHCQFVQKLLGRLAAHSAVLDAGCGAGRYEQMLLEAGHRVLGIDQSGNMLARARQIYPTERFPGLRFVQMGLQEMDFEADFDGTICVDALEHVCPEDWPGILARFHQALRPGGVLYVTVEEPDWGEAREAYERARELGLPVVFGEVVEDLDLAGAQDALMDWQGTSGEQADLTVYHYYPRPEQVRTWLDQVGLAIEEEGTGDGYAHLLVRKWAR